MAAQFSVWTGIRVSCHAKLMKKTIRAVVGSGVILTASYCGAEESLHHLPDLSTTTINGFVDTSVGWNLDSAPQSIPEPSALAFLAVGGAVLLGLSAARNRK